MSDAGRFGLRLGACRESAGLTQEELAARSGLSIRSISNLECGRTRRPHPDSARRLADALDLRGDVRAGFIAAASGHQPPALAAEAAGAGPPASTGPSPGAAGIVPRQLPGQVRHFVGRAAELAALSGLLNDVGTPPTLLISAIGGTAGVGKTALALQWAHQVAGQFPDGQLYVDLRGYDADQPMPAADALARFLRALGVAGQQIPAELDERAAAYRSLLAGRRVLIVLDNVREVEQARPLLPGGPSCVVVVTSRDALAGLVARDGAARLELDLLPLDQAVGLLRELIGERAAAEPDAARQLAACCCRLPLALRVAAELAITRPDVSLASLAAEVSDIQRRLDLLDAGGDTRTAVRAVFSWSYRHLDDTTAAAFRAIGLHPGPELEAYAVAALTGGTLQQAARTLERLARAHLIQACGPGRYGMHDLLRGYARELAADRDQDAAARPPPGLTGLFDHYLHSTAVAMDTLFPADHDRRPPIPVPASPVPPVSDETAARAWLAAERANLVAAVTHAADHGWPHHATRLSARLHRHLEASGHLPEMIIIHGHARRAAAAAGDHAAEAEALGALAAIDLRQGRYRPSAGRYQQALALWRAIGDRTGEARALASLGVICERQGRYPEAAARFQQALVLHEGDHQNQAHVLVNLGAVDTRQGRYQQAIRHFQRALALHRAAGERTGEARALASLGDVDLRQARYQRAAGYLQQALVQGREIGDRTVEAYALINLGLVCLRQGRYQQAAGHLRRAQVLCREIGDSAGETEVLNGIGEVLCATGHPEEARRQHAAALALARETGDQEQQARARYGLGHADQAAGDTGRARRHWRAALALYNALGAPEAGQVRRQLAAARPDPAAVGDAGRPRDPARSDCLAAAAGELGAGQPGAGHPSAPAQ